MQVAVQGSESERGLGELIAKEAPGAVDLCGKLDLPAMGGFISRCSAFVSNDSGPMHMARALGVPTLAIFGSTDPAMFEFGGSIVNSGTPHAAASHPVPVLPQATTLWRHTWSIHAL